MVMKWHFSNATTVNSKQCRPLIFPLAAFIYLCLLWWKCVFWAFLPYHLLFFRESSEDFPGLSLHNSGSNKWKWNFRLPHPFPLSHPTRIIIILWVSLKLRTKGRKRKTSSMLLGFVFSSSFKNKQVENWISMGMRKTRKKNCIKFYERLRTAKNQVDSSSKK